MLLMMRSLSDRIILSFSCVFFLPVEELLCEAVLHVAGWRVLLHPSLQQHLLIHLPLLLLLLQVLLHAETLPVIFLYVLCGVTPLDKQTHAHKAIF